jgi:L-ascorbate metabolism protein UlaG (beta-lactamase superfamily)
VKARQRALVATAAVLGSAAAWIAVQRNRRPRLEAYAPLALPRSGAAPGRPSGVTVVFLGVSTLLFDDGDTALMTDGFFTRPPLLRLVRVAPDRDVIARSLRRAGVTSLAAVIPVHSHYDHALDSAVVAQETGAMLVGSASSANIARGAGLPEERIKVVGHGETLRFGRFEVTLLPSVHSPRALFRGEITAPLSPPASAGAYRMGDCYSVLIEHDGRTILVQGSAGYIPGALNGRKADVVYLGVGTLGKLGDAYRDAYWREVVGTVGARRVIVVHWDDFCKPLGEPLVPLPWLVDDFDVTMRFLRARGESAGVDVRVPVAWAATDPFAGLTPSPPA